MVVVGLTLVSPRSGGPAGPQGSGPGRCCRGSDLDVVLDRDDLLGRGRLHRGEGAAEADLDRVLVELAVELAQDLEREAAARAGAEAGPVDRDRLGAVR